VYAYVVSTTETGPAQLRVKLEIFATLAGAYDAAKEPVLETELYYGGKGSAIKNAPAGRSYVVAIVQRLRDVNGRALDRKVIPSAYMKFMPNEAAILEVNGFDDPKVRELISRLRRLRASAKDAAKE
jgi:hypothetical protein